MKIISFKICPFVQRVTALLEAKNISYDIEFIDLSDKPQWFLELSPTGQVPVLITNANHVLFESDAIVEYLEEAFPALQQGLSAEERALNRAWSHLASKNYLVQCSAQRSPDASTLNERSDKLGKAFDRMENRLNGSRFFSGEKIGMVDVAWLPLLHRADIMVRRSGFDFVGDRPRLKTWQSELLATPMAENSVAPDFEDSFSAFYLSDQTFLGRGQSVANCEFGKTCATDACC